MLGIARNTQPARALSATPTVLCFGDSWTDGNSQGLREQLRKHGHGHVKVVNKDFWGSTAEYFASNPKLLPESVRNHQAEFVLLSMGGNDYKNVYYRDKQYVTPWTAVAGIEKNLRVVLDALFQEHPDVKVVTYGYDYPGDAGDALTGGMLGVGDSGMSATMKAGLWIYQMVGVPFINWGSHQFGATLEKLSKEYTDKGYSLTYVPLWGSLQQAADGKVNYFKPSPSTLMRDAIHATPEGYNVLLGKLYNAYFGKIFAQPPSM